MKITSKALLREMRNVRRRKGGLRRMRMEVLLDRAWSLGWLDGFRQDAIEYVAQAEASLLQDEKMVREHKTDVIEPIVVREPR